MIIINIMHVYIQPHANKHAAYGRLYKKFNTHIF